MSSHGDPADPRVMYGETWRAFCETLQRASSLVLGEGVPDTPRDRSEGFRYLTRLLAASIVTCMEFADPDEPEFGRMVDHRMKWGLDCPDCLYLYATIRGDATYRITGSRGTANHIDIQVNYGHFALGDIAQWGTISSINSPELESDHSGVFELFLGGEERPRNWLRLAPNAEFVLVRQYFNDWEREEPADMIIERIGASVLAPAPRTDQIAARLERLCMWLERGGALWERMSRAALALPPNSINVFLPQDSDKRAGLRGQAYGLGNFCCAPGEAVIVEFAPPPCRHWSVGLANWYWESLDFVTRQTSLNGHQAALDPDGVFRGIIAHEDPGVPNWLDTAGHGRGTLTARFLLAEAAPEIRFRTVSLGELDAALPSGLPRIGPEARARALRARCFAALRRYRR